MNVGESIKFDPLEKDRMSVHKKIMKKIVLVCPLYPLKEYICEVEVLLKISEVLMSTL